MAIENNEKQPPHRELRYCPCLVFKFGGAECNHLRRENGLPEVTPVRIWNREDLIQLRRNKLNRL